MYTIKTLNIKRNRLVKSEWTDFLLQSDIRPEAHLDGVLGVYDGERLIASGSYFQNILKCIAVDYEYQGGAVLGQLITALLDCVWENDYKSVYVYTKPAAAKGFEHLGFKELARVEDQMVFMEKGVRGFDDYAASIAPFKKSGETLAAIVMNANPFSLGHLHLIETAASKSDWLYVFVVSEDASAFSTAVRKRLVLEGTAHLDNVTVLDTGNYMVSSQTFPSYFLKEDVDVTQVQATLDATLFAQKIAPLLGINHRYLGEEPLSEATAIYNTALKSVLEPAIKVVIIPRKQSGDQIISASYIRHLIQSGDMAAVKNFVPESTYHFLGSLEAEQIISNLRNGGK